MSVNASGHLAVHKFVIGEQLDPHIWRRAAQSEDGEMWVNIQSQMKVIWSVADELDGRTWLHVSVSRPDRIPSYSDMTRVKELFVGDDRTAYTVMAPASNHVNIHERCLHLWCVLEGDEPLPDFTPRDRFDMTAVLVRTTWIREIVIEMPALPVISMDETDAEWVADDGAEWTFLCNYELATP